MQHVFVWAHHHGQCPADDEDDLRAVVLVRLGGFCAGRLELHEVRVGQSLKIAVTDGGVMINNAKVVTTDITTSNGVIHVIDTVLLPAAK